MRIFFLRVDPWIKLIIPLQVLPKTEPFLFRWVEEKEISRQRERESEERERAETEMLSTSGKEAAHWKCNTLLPSHRSAGNLNFKRNMNNILFYFENELCALHHESNICLNLLGSWSRRLQERPPDSCHLIRKSLVFSSLFSFLWVVTQKIFIFESNW